MARAHPANSELDRFLQAWFDARQMIQSANFNRFQRAGLSATQFMTLNLLPAKDGSLHLSELARRMNLSPATVSKTVDSLEARKMLTRTQSEKDGRLVLLSLTAKGKALQNAASTEFHDHMDALFSTLTSRQREGLITGLESLVNADRKRRAITQGDPQE